MAGSVVADEVATSAGVSPVADTAVTDELEERAQTSPVAGSVVTDEVATLAGVSPVADTAVTDELVE